MASPNTRRIIYFWRMKALFILLVTLVPFSPIVNSKAYEKEIKGYQKEMNKSYKKKSSSPLEEADRKKFKKHPFFAIDANYSVTAYITLTPEEEPFEMKTSTDRLPIYRKYGIASFELYGATYELSLYESGRLKETEEFEDYLFLPFRDHTSGEETYGGGRYIDLDVPDGDRVTIDFNKAYHPYCAYNHAYSCPIPPSENYLETRVAAGIRLE